MYIYIFIYIYIHRRVCVRVCEDIKANNDFLRAFCEIVFKVKSRANLYIKIKTFQKF